MKNDIKKPKYVEKRDNSIKNQRKFVDMTANKLAQIHFDSCLTTDPNIDYNRIENILVSSYEECIP